MCELLVGLPDVNVRAVADEGLAVPLRVHVESRLDQGWCRECGARASIKDRPAVTLVDLPCFGRPTRLVWHKQRWWCRERACAAGSWTIVEDRIAVARGALTDRAARWATVQVGRRGRSVNEVARELGCDSHTVNDAVVAYGEALLDADTDRVGAIDALGLDETLFFRKGTRHLKQWCTSVVDVGGSGRGAKLIEVTQGRTAAKVSDRLDAQPAAWRQAGDPRGEVRMCWHAKETTRGLYDIDDPQLACEYLDELIDDMHDSEMPPEVRSLGRTLRRWRDHIVAWHQARVTNGPTEAINNLALPTLVWAG